MSGAEKTNFTQRSQAASFTDADAAAALTVPGEIVSVNGRMGPSNRFLVKFATLGGEVGPLILNQTSAEALKHLLQNAGF
jgi:hypothetical protein